MASPTKVKVLGFIDIFTVLCQAVVVVATTVASLHSLDIQYYDSENNEAKRKPLWTIAPIFVGIGAGLVLFIDTGQIVTTSKILHATNPLVRVTEFGVIAKDWLSWNEANVYASLLWFMIFGIPLTLDNGWPLGPSAIFFLGFGFVRVVLAYFVKTMATQVFPAAGQVDTGDVEMHCLPYSEA